VSRQQYRCFHLESASGVDGQRDEEEDPSGFAHSTSPCTQEAHDDLYKFITEEKDKLGGDDSVLLLPGLLTLAEIHIIECTPPYMQHAPRRLNSTSTLPTGVS
jgi:hypothetical protein